MFNSCRMRSRNRLQLIRMAAGLVAVLAATSAQDSELPYRIIRASRTLGGASARILSASIAASTAEIGEEDEAASEATEESMKANLPAEAREDCVHIILIFMWMIG
jgi:hypothetical protein